jgi:hypothetical protein
VSLVLVFVLAVAADTATFLLLPAGAEMNPLVLLLGPVAAIALRWLAVALLLLAIPHLSRGREGLLLVGIFAGAVGFGANLAVLL